MSEDRTYNGWSNRETWLVKLWLDNDEGDYSYWREAAEEIVNGSKEGEDATGDEKRDAAYSLAKRLEEEITEAAPEVKGLWSDLLSTALGSVDWQEIAEAMVEDLD